MRIRQGSPLANRESTCYACAMTRRCLHVGHEDNMNGRCLHKEKQRKSTAVTGQTCQTNSVERRAHNGC